ncbi:uncharacterized protein LOC111015072 [Momordica charantia]|uniref:Uncharacterized protein LOC111015072 n=1 Tax=Momordica charantia TaxID=3673 RepID=A0A6J1CV59_MOMCH|nr:uncharacterized protein LOC111015072 [Momordica charantia]
MSSLCTASYCISDAGRPPRGAYINLHSWTDSDAEIAKSASSRARRRVLVADGVSCRQMYLRSYKFSRKESVPEKTRRCLGRVKEKIGERKRRRGVKSRNRKRKCLIWNWRKMKEFSCSCILFGIFRRILSCAASVDVVEHSTGRN